MSCHDEEHSHAPCNSVCWVMEGHNEGVSLGGHLITIVMRNLGSHDAIVDRRRNLHDLQAAKVGHNEANNRPCSASLSICFLPRMAGRPQNHDPDSYPQQTQCRWNGIVVVSRSMHSLGYDILLCAISLDIPWSVSCP